MRLGPLLLLACLVAMPAGAVPRSPSGAVYLSAENASLRSIAGWLKKSGAEGWLAGEVADTVGIPRKPGEDLLEARQRGFRTDGVLRIAQISRNDARDFMIFMAQRPDGEVHLHFATLREGWRGSYISIPEKHIVVPLEHAEALERFQDELAYWELRMAGGG
jgi:hypothetical protein